MGVGRNVPNIKVWFSWKSLRFMRQLFNHIEAQYSAVEKTSALNDMCKESCSPCRYTQFLSNIVRSFYLGTDIIRNVHSYLHEG